jgi:cytochrome c553
MPAASREHRRRIKSGACIEFADDSRKIRRMQQFKCLFRSAVLIAIVPGAAAHSLAAEATAPDPIENSAPPGWLYPINPPSIGAVAPLDQIRPLHLPRSSRTFTQVALNDLFHAPDWRPHSHGSMPDIVARGRPPEVYACGYCHSPSGQGRPENASLAGLPAPYILQQLSDFKSGARRRTWTDAYRPVDLMIHVAAYVTPEEAATAAQYFAAQQLVPRAVVVESARVPRSRVAGWVYVAIPKAGREPLGTRLMEFAPDLGRHEKRDDAMRYVAYAPPGSITRGRKLASSGADATMPACAGCHGAQLQGLGSAPPLGGRSPTYILRQLIAFRSGARAGAMSPPMRAVVARLTLDDMIGVAAYAATLPP